jgi:hypothetical protein
MRSIEVKSWNVKTPDGKEVIEDTLMLLSLLVTNQDPATLPRGYEQFKLFTKLIKAFEKAQETRILLLEEDTYKFLRNTIEKNIPSIWGTNFNIVGAIELFMNCKEE